MRYIDIPLKRIQASNGVNFAYREVGPIDKLPIIMLNHLSATLDDWDPRLIDTLSQQYHLILVDNSGVGTSSGEVPKTIQEMALQIIIFLKAMNIKSFDLLGISMGGMVAQEIAIRVPNMVKHLILVGTAPRGGKGLTKINLVTNLYLLKALLTLKNVKEYLFFTTTKEGKKAAKSYIKRISSRQKQYDQKIRLIAYINQLLAIKAWGKQKKIDFSNLYIPTLIVNGDKDIMVPTINSYELRKDIPNSKLYIYPDAGHMSLFQYPKKFLENLNLFFAEK